MIGRTHTFRSWALALWVTGFAMLPGCGEAERARNDVFRYEPLGWNFTVPPGWEERENAKRDAVRAKGKKILEEGTDGQLAGTSTPVLYLSSGDDNRFTSDVQPYDESADGPYAELQTAALQSVIQALEAQNIALRHETTTLEIDGVPFAAMTMEILAADGETVVATSTIIDGLVGDTSFSMSYTCRSEAQRDEIRDAIMMSEFDNP